MPSSPRRRYSGPCRDAQTAFLASILPLTVVLRVAERVHSAGRILGSMGDTSEPLVVVWELSEASDWEDRISYLPTLSDFRTSE
jgi:hypothetical protein